MAGRARRFVSALFPAGTSFWTGALIAVNVAIYLATVRGGGLGAIWSGPTPQQLLADGGVSAYSVYGAHQLARTVTYQFLHGGLLHIGFNMYALLVLGPMTEKLFGRARFLFIYLLSGVAGALLATGVRYLLFVHHGAINLAAPTPGDRDAFVSLIEPTIGASGALVGLMGAMLATTLKPGTRTTPQLRRVVVQWLVYVFVFGWLLKADNLAHLGGLIAGFLIGLVLAESWRERRAPRALWNAIAVALAAAVVLCFVQILRTPPPLPFGG